MTRIIGTSNRATACRGLGKHDIHSIYDYAFHTRYCTRLPYNPPFFSITM